MIKLIYLHYLAFIFLTALSGLPSTVLAQDQRRIDNELERVVVIGHRERREIGPGFARILDASTGTGNKQNASAENKSSTKNTCPQPVSGQPVIIGTGEKLLPQSDFTHESMAPLSLSRQYRSNPQNSARPTLFGPNWQSSLEIPAAIKSTQCRYVDRTELDYAGCLPTSVSVSLTDGTTYKYIRPNDSGSDTYSLNGDISNTGSTAGFAVVDSQFFTVYMHDLQLVFDAYTFKIVQMTQRGNQKYYYDYSGDKLIRVRNNGGQAVNFGWSGDRVVNVTDPASNIWTYEYDSLKRLFQVTPPSG
jgi:YD repeat-containing protein